MQHPAIERLQALSTATFTTARKGGYNPQEVDRHLEHLRQVVAEVAAIEPPEPVAPEPVVPPEPSEEVLRVLQLAEASGAQVIREAESQAEAIRAKARSDADQLTADTIRELQAARRDLERLRAAATETRDSVDRQLRESSSAAKTILEQAAATLGRVTFASVELPDLPVTETVLDRMAAAPVVTEPVAAENHEPVPTESHEVESDSHEVEDVYPVAPAPPVAAPDEGTPDAELTLPPPTPLLPEADEEHEAELDEKFQRFWNSESDLADKWRINPNA